MAAVTTVTAVIVENNVTSGTKKYKGAVYRTARWLRLTELMRSRHPLCQLCGTKPSECTDHVDGDTANWCEGNMRALCWSCHSWKTKTPYTDWVQIVAKYKEEMYEE